MIVKKHETADRRLLLTVCDEDILNKKFGEGEIELDLTSDFYKGKKEDEEEILKLIKKSFMITFVGKGSVELAIKNGFVDKGKIIYVEKVPYIQSILISE